MKNKWIKIVMSSAFALLIFSRCASLKSNVRDANVGLPSQFSSASDSLNLEFYQWKNYFNDGNLTSLIDTALKKNQDLNIILQEIEVNKNEVRARKGEYLPFVGLGAGAGVEKPGRYTRNGAIEEQIEIAPGKALPSPLADLMLGAYASWEIDVWKKLRNAKKAAYTRYMASVEGRNFLVTNLVAEISESYYELMALDNLLDIIERSIDIQSNALTVVQMQKASAKVTQLAVNRFEAQLLRTKNFQFSVRQKIIETENRINFLTGRYPTPIQRSSLGFNDLQIDRTKSGIPSQLLANRPDIRQAELALEAAKLDVKVARANFYPSIGIRGGVGFQAFNPKLLINPQSILFNLAGDLVSPLINKNAIKAIYFSANAKQLQAVYNYEQTILMAYVDVLNQMSKMDNYSQSYSTKSEEVRILMESVNIANSLFNSARADYGEVLFTQREALESKMELIEIKMKLMNAKVNIYRALGGGWR
jgi:multidrug efflux system outer membrane protein